MLVAPPPALVALLLLPPPAIDALGVGLGCTGALSPVGRSAALRAWPSSTCVWAMCRQRVAYNLCVFAYLPSYPACLPQPHLRMGNVSTVWEE